MVFDVGIAAAVPVKAGQRVKRAGPQCAAQNIQGLLDHGGSGV
jgi:hypothetical protein